MDPQNWSLPVRIPSEDRFVVLPGIEPVYRGGQYGITNLMLVRQVLWLIMVSQEKSAIDHHYFHVYDAMLDHMRECGFLNRDMLNASINTATIVTDRVIQVAHFYYYHFSPMLARLNGEGYDVISVDMNSIVLKKSTYHTLDNLNTGVVIDV